MGGERFRYTVHKDDVVRIFWQGRCVMTVGGSRGRALRADLEAAGDEEAQHLLQRVTGNFKRGNERSGRRGR